MYIYIHNGVTGDFVTQFTDIELEGIDGVLLDYNGNIAECWLTSGSTKIITTEEPFFPSVPAGEVFAGLTLTQGGTDYFAKPNQILPFDYTGEELTVYTKNVAFAAFDVTVKSKDGTAEKTVIQNIANPVVKASLAVTDGNATLTLTDNQNSVYTGTWAVTVDFAGLSLSANGPKSISVGDSDKPLSISIAAALYEFEVIQPRPPVNIYISRYRGYGAESDIASFIGIQPVKQVSFAFNIFSGVCTLKMIDIFDSAHQCEWIVSGDIYSGYEFDGIRKDAPFPNGTLLIGKQGGTVDVDFSDTTVLFESIRYAGREGITLKVNNGAAEVASIADIGYIRKLKLTVTDLLAKITAVDAGGLSFDATFTVPDGFLGLALTDGGNIYIGKNEEKNVTIDADTTLYFVTDTLTQSIDVFIYGKDGMTLKASLTGIPYAKSIRLESTATSVKLTLRNDAGENIAEWTPDDQTKFIGLSETVGGSIYIYNNTKIDRNITNDLTLYEIESEVKPYDIELYKSTAEQQVIDKAPFLTSVMTMTGAFRNEAGLTDPVIVFASHDVPVFNYAYIPDFHRYYYLVKLETVRTGFYRMYLHADVKMSFKESILAQKALIKRNENKYNPYLQDDCVSIESKPQFVTYDFAGSDFENLFGNRYVPTKDPRKYVLTVWAVR